jgi:hypothetical protein
VSGAAAAAPAEAVVVFDPAAARAAAAVQVAVGFVVAFYTFGKICLLANYIEIGYSLNANFTELLSLLLHPTHSGVVSTSFAPAVVWFLSHWNL